MANQETDRLIEIGCMVALAERFASEGQMNLNKILEAIAYAQIRRASCNYRPEITTQTMQSELAQCLDNISQADIWHHTGKEAEKPDESCKTELC